MEASTKRSRLWVAAQLRAFGWGIVAVPLALADLYRAAGRRSGRAWAVGRAVLGVPVAVAASGLTALLSFLVLINVLAYPFRPFLGLSNKTGGIWASTYGDSWGGPTLAGAWAVHAGGILLIAVPLAGWAVRALSRGRRRLIADPMALPAPSPRAWTALTSPVSTGDTARTERESKVGSSAVAAAPRPAARSNPGLGWRRTGLIGAAIALSAGLSLTFHQLGIGDNLLWTPKDLASTAALAITVAPLVGLAMVTRNRWRNRKVRV